MPLPSVKYQYAHKQGHNLATMNQVNPDTPTNHADVPAATLLLDMGNTRLKLGWLINTRSQRETFYLTLAYADIADLPRLLAQHPIRPVAALGVNVAGEHKAQQLTTLLQQHYGVAVSWVSSQANAGGVSNTYLDPAQLGADRWLAMIGLSRQPNPEAQPMMLASFGTATTIDTLNTAPPNGARTATWQFVGGLILPGLALMRASLAKGTANLPNSEGTSVAFPLSTTQAINTGIAAAQAGAVYRQWQMALINFGMPVRLFCTGGAWPELASEVQAVLASAHSAHGLPAYPIQWLEAPVLDGLAQLALATG